MGDWLRRHKMRTVGAASAVLAAATIAVVGHRINQAPIADHVLWLRATRDLGALPARGTGAGEFCGSVGTLGTPEHCYTMQEASGNLTDSVGGLTLTAAGTLRYAVAAGVPVQGASVAWDEKGIASDGSGRFTGASMDTVAAVASFTFVYKSQRSTAAYYLFSWGLDASPHGYNVSINAGLMSVRANLGTYRVYNLPSFVADDGAIHCVTIAYNGANTSAWIDGAAAVFNSGWADYGSTTGAEFPILMAASDGLLQLQGALYRFRLDHAAATLADHKLLCGEYTRPLRANHSAWSDTSWTQTGGARCFATSATTAVCLPGGAAGYAYDATLGAIGWAQEPGRTNRILNSAALNNWTVTGNPELLADGDMEAAGTGSWTAEASATLTKETASPHGGARNLRIAYNGTNYPIASQVVASAGSYYRYSGWCRSDGAWSCSVYVGGTTTLSGCSITETVWTQKSATVLSAGTKAYFQSNAAGAGYAEFDDVSLTLHGTPAVAPDGSKTAYDLASTATITSATATGYGNNATLYPRAWVKCTGAATVTLEATVGAGEWTVDCSHASLSGNWALIHGTHAAVTEVVPWTASAGGEVNFVASGTAAYSLWLPTLTEEDGLSVIPTTTAAVATGDAALVIDNSPPQYWWTSATIQPTLTQLSGTCLVTGDPLRLSGAVGSECVGVWHGLEILR